MATTPSTEWPSQHAGFERLHVARADGLRNRRRLLEAAAGLLAGGEPFTLSDVAEAAGLATATAYRHFGSADAVTEAFVAGFWDDVDRRVSDPGGRVPSLAELSDIWVRAAVQWGPALAHLRSREGFLLRRERGDARVARMVGVAEPTIRAELRATGRVSPHRLSYALSIWNVLADPREIVDQSTTLGWTQKRIAEILCGSVRAVIAEGARGRVS